jgi:hypothetical protein
MPSQRQIEANRRNALRSTGPRTPGGKYIAARNRTLHGFSSPEPVLPDEDPAEFAATTLNGFRRPDVLFSFRRFVPICGTFRL